MTYGFTVYNENGGILANDTDYSLGLYQEGTVNLDPNAGPIPPIDITVTGIQETPIIFFRVINSRRTVVLGVDTETTNTVRLIFTPFDTTYSENDSYPVTVEYRVYVPMKYLSPPPGEVYGVLVYDPNGNTTFDSRLKIPVITNTYDVTFPAWNGSYISGQPNTQAVNFAGYPWLYTTDTSNLSKGVYYAGDNAFGPIRRRFTTGVRVANNKLLYEYVIDSYNIGYGDGPLSWNNASGKTYSVFMLQSSAVAMSAWIDVYSNGDYCSYQSGSCQTRLLHIFGH
jgi:hypothetical protein